MASAGDGVSWVRPWGGTEEVGTRCGLPRTVPAGSGQAWGAGDVHMYRDALYKIVSFFFKLKLL